MLQHAPCPLNYFINIRRHLVKLIIYNFFASFFFLQDNPNRDNI